VVEEFELLEAVDSGGAEEVVEVGMDSGPAGCQQEEAADGDAMRPADVGHEADTCSPRANAQAVAVEVDVGELGKNLTPSKR
jgi:hypothetical protein